MLRKLDFLVFSLQHSYPRYLARSFHFILPYFPTGTMERVDTEGQIATAKVIIGEELKTIIENHTKFMRRRRICKMIMMMMC